MRIISQNREIDLQYDKFVITIQEDHYNENENERAYVLVAILAGDDIISYVLGKYTNKNEAKAAMEGIRLSFELGENYHYIQ